MESGAADAGEIREIVYEGDGAFVALSPSFPGVTAEGPTREASIEALRRKIRAANGGGPEGESQGGS
jgi:hypothetical protein